MLCFQASLTSGSISPDFRSNGKIMNTSPYLYIHNVHKSSSRSFARENKVENNFVFVLSFQV